jgi:hypothetical protein
VTADAAALQRFESANVRFGSFTTDAVEATRACMSAFAPKADKRADVLGRPLCAIRVISRCNLVGQIEAEYRDLTTTHGVRARHDQLTNAALAAWFGALRSRDLETKSL